MSGIINTLTKRQLKSKGFRYKPMYYNQEKAEFKAMVERMRQERDASERGESLRVNFKGSFSSQIGKKTHYQKSIALYNLRLIALLLGLGFGAYYLFQSHDFNHYLNHFLNALTKKDGLY